MHHRHMMYYADDEQRAREMEMAAAERQMGCSSCTPFGTIFSRAIKGRNGRDERSRKKRLDYAMAYPPAQTYYVQPNARTITVSANNSHQSSSAPASHHAVPPAYAPSRASGSTGNKPRKKKKKKRVAFAPDAAGPPMSGHGPPHAGYAPPHAGHTPQHAAVSASPGYGAAAPSGSVYHQGGAAEEYSYPQAPPPPGQYSSRQHGAGHAYGYGHGHYGRYYCAPSPLTTRWDAARTPRRYEYFSGEYRWYYPTPVRESIYSFATDANHRLTATFSEENPNACAIV